MHEEHPIIPERPGTLPNGPWLVFAPSLDDALRGMGGTLLLGSRQTIAITLVVLNAQTAAEAPLAIAVRAWPRPDHLAQSDAFSALLAELHPASVFLPAPLEPQAVCRAVTTQVWEALTQYAFTGTAYTYEISQQSPVNYWIDISAVAADKATLTHAETTRTGALTAAVNRTRGLLLAGEITHAEAFYAFATVAGSLAAQIVHSLTPCWRREESAAQPLVSVIIRTRNRPKFLQEALQSVAVQTYAPIEVVVVNDGGEDVAAEVQAYAGPALAQLRYLDLQPGRGRSAAANTGLAAASGDYLIFLDDDDWFMPDHIAVLVETLQQGNAAVAYAGVECVQSDEQGAWQRVHVFGRPFDPIQLLIDNYIPMHAALFRRELVKAGCRFDEAMDTFEDWDFWVQLAQKTAFIYVDRISAVYRIGRTGGFGVGGDQRRIRQATEYFLNKWRQRWTLEQMLDIVAYAKHKSLYGELAESLASKQRQLDETRQVQAELVERIEARNADICELRQAKEQLASLLAYKDQQLAFAEQHLLAEQSQQGQQPARLVQVQEQLHHAQSYIQALNEQIARFERSSSWRITRPLRVITEGLRRVRRTVRKRLLGAEDS